MHWDRTLDAGSNLGWPWDDGPYPVGLAERPHRGSNPANFSRRHRSYVSGAVLGLFVYCCPEAVTAQEPGGVK